MMCLPQLLISWGRTIKHVTFGLFETIKTISQALAKSLIDLLDKYELRKQIVYVKNEGSNLNAMISKLKNVEL